MNDACFSIGIPTYNRCKMLSQSLASALGQQGISIEVIICDNASTDDTQGFCESLQDSRVKYFRNSENVGPIPNWEKCLKLAKGEYFAWLQDDDLIFPDFALRAAQAMTSTGSDAYLASSIQATSPSVIYRDGLYALPIVMDWASGRTVQVPRDLIIPLSLYCTVGMPPTIAFKTCFLRKIFHAWDRPEIVLFCERLLTVQAAISGKVIAAPHIAGIFRIHEQQAHKQIISDEGIGGQWTQFVNILSTIATEQKVDLAVFRDYVKALPDGVLLSFLTARYPCSSTTLFYPAVNQLIENEVELRKLRIAPGPPKVSLLKGVFKSLCPPIVKQIRDLAVCRR